jgi:chromosomal replication initiation ATPase DnaA
MKSQLTLTFGETVSYSSETFIAHEGSREIADTLITLAAEKRFALVYIQGAPKTGKTHLSVYCAGLLRSLEASVDVVSGEQASRWYVDRFSGSRAIPSGQSLIIDDADRWIGNPTAEGGFTAMADAISQSKGVLVLLGSVAADKLEVSAQIKSRLKAGVQLELGSCEDWALDAILKAMCAQRGLKLSDAKRRFVLARVERSIPALSSFLERLQALGRSASNSTSFDLLAAAVGEGGESQG